MPIAPSSVLALDVGGARIGVAVASLAARLPHPLVTLTSSDEILIQDIQKIIAQENIGHVVVGLPRGLDGQHTPQTEETLQFYEHLKSQLSLPIDLQDEAVTSKRAKTELDSRGKTYSKADIDALAATYILEDWLSEHKDAI